MTITSTIAAAVTAVVLGQSCGRPQSLVVPPESSADTSTASGMVTGAQGEPVPGAGILDLQSATQTESDAEGHFTITLTRRNTVSLLVTAAGFAPTSLMPFELGDEDTDQLRIVLITRETLQALASFASVNEPRGVVAVTPVSPNGSCVPSGATIAARGVTDTKTFYVSLATGALDFELTALEGGEPAAFMSGVPVASAMHVSFDKPGCTELGFPVVWRRVRWLGDFRVHTEWLSQIYAFVD